MFNCISGMFIVNVIKSKHLSWLKYCLAALSIMAEIQMASHGKSYHII